MKKLLAIMFALILVFSFAACGKDSDNDDATTTVADSVGTNQAVEVPVPTQNQDSADALIDTPVQTSDEDEDSTTTDTVEAWITANPETVDEFCALSSYEEDGVTMTFAMQATGNDLNLIQIADGDLSADDILEFQEEAAEAQAEWDAMSAEDKELILSYYIVDDTMPVPTSVTMVVYDATGNEIASVYYGN